jgi:hypothetical protein
LLAFINWNSRALIRRARAHTKISTQHDLRHPWGRRCQYEQLYNEICRRPRPLLSVILFVCGQISQPPRYQDTQHLARLAGSSLQSKTTCPSKFVGWNLAFIPRSSCLHQGSTRAVQNSDLAALGQTANKLPINSPCQSPYLSRYWVPLPRSKAQEPRGDRRQAVP